MNKYNICFCIRLDITQHFEKSRAVFHGGTTFGDILIDVDDLDVVLFSILPYILFLCVQAVVSHLVVGTDTEVYIGVPDNIFFHVIRSFHSLS